MNFKQLHRMIIDQMFFRKCFYRLRRYMFCFAKHVFLTINVKIMFVVISFKKANALCGSFIIESTLWMFTGCHPWSLNMMPRKQVLRWSNRLSILFWVACCILDYRFADSSANIFLIFVVLKRGLYVFILIIVWTWSQFSKLVHYF